MLRLENVLPVSGDWYCNKKGSGEIPRVATQGENGPGRAVYLRGNVINYQREFGECETYLSLSAQTVQIMGGGLVCFLPRVLYLMVTK